jgi:hypothetical protein
MPYQNAYFFLQTFNLWLFPEDKINRQDQKDKSYQVIPPKRFVFKDQQGENGENNQCDHLLNYFQFDQAKRSAITPESDPVGRDLKAVLEKGNTPADQYNSYEPEFMQSFDLTEL